MWYKLSFSFKQNEINKLRSSTRTNHVTISVVIFDMSLLNTDNYPNTYVASGSNNSDDVTWTYSYFGQRNCYTNSTTNEYVCKRSAFEYILSDESLEKGIKTGSVVNWWNDSVYMTFPSINKTHEWIDLSVVFRLDIFENKYGCDNCYPAFLVTNNGAIKWGQYISWSIKNITFERLVNNVTYETPITSFDSEIVDLPRMDTLEEVVYKDDGDFWNRSNCPHLTNSSILYEWHDPNTWSNGIVPDTTTQNITIPVGKSVIIRSCSSVANETNPYQRV